MPSITHAAKRFVVVSCSHGEFINREAAQKTLDFIREYRPHRVYHLGDAIDCAPFRAGALRDGSEGNMEADLQFAMEFMEHLSPHVWFMGNHEHRVYALRHSRNEVVAYAANDLVTKIQSLAKRLKAEIVPYAGTYNPESCRHIGGTVMLHGWLFGENATRDTVEMIGAPVIHGHTHRAVIQSGRMQGSPQGISVGCLCDIDAMSYAHTRRQTTTWQHACCWGEFSDKWCKANLKVFNTWQRPEIRPAK